MKVHVAHGNGCVYARGMNNTKAEATNTMTTTELVDAATDAVVEQRGWEGRKSDTGSLTARCTSTHTTTVDGVTVVTQTWTERVAHTFGGTTTEHKAHFVVVSAVSADGVAVVCNVQAVR